MFSCNSLWISVFFVSVRPAEEPAQVDKKSKEQGKAGKSANQYNQRRRTGRLPGGQKGRKGKTLTKEQVQELLNGEDVIHHVVHIGKKSLLASGTYVCHASDIKH